VNKVCPIQFKHEQNQNTEEELTFLECVLFVWHNHTSSYFKQLKRNVLPFILSTWYFQAVEISSQNSLLNGSSDNTNQENPLNLKEQEKYLPKQNFLNPGIATYFLF
jgi:hypothetical protein